MLYFNITSCYCYIERFSFKCSKTKTKVINLTNHNTCKQHKRPIRIRSKCMKPAPSAGKHVQPSHDWFWFSFSLVNGMSSVNQSQSAVKQNQSNYQITFDTQMKTALWKYMWNYCKSRKFTNMQLTQMKQAGEYHSNSLVL